MRTDPVETDFFQEDQRPDCELLPSRRSRSVAEKGAGKRSARYMTIIPLRMKALMLVKSEYSEASCFCIF